MPVTEFDDSEHYGLFLTNPNRLDSSTVMRVRMSELTLAALRAAGVLDNMIDGTSAPATDKLWLDKNFDPAVLKEWDATGASWVPMTFDRLFGRAAVGQLTVTGGTGNAVVVSEPSGFKADRLYLITPTADNTTAVTIQVSGVGTYPAKYGDGSDLLSGEFTTGRQSVLLFDGVKFVAVFSIAGLNGYVTAAAASASAAATSEANAFGFAGDAAGSASAAATSATNAASAAATVLTGATSDDTFADTDQVIYLTGSTTKKGTLTGLISSIFATARTIGNAQFAAASFKLYNAAGTPRALSHDTTALTADRVATWPDAPVNFSLMSQLGMGQSYSIFATSAGVGRQNTTGKPILAFLMYGASTTITFSVSSDGVTYNVIYDHSGGGSRASSSVIIPNGHYYRTNQASSVWELK